MAHKTSQQQDTNLGIPLDIEEARHTAEEFSPIVIPGSEQDKSRIVDFDHDIVDQGDLEAHAKAAELDHPQGCVTTKHLEPSIRALLEALIQGDDEAVLREKVRFEQATTFEAAATFEADVSFEDDIGVLGGVSIGRQLLQPPVVKTADFIILDDDYSVFEVTTAAIARTGTLPTLADNLGRVIEIHKVDDGTGKVVLDGEGAETIDGVTSIDLDLQYDYCKVRGGTTCWHLIEYKDHGSNAHGEWYRYKDGRQFCEHKQATDDCNNVSGNIYRTDENVWTFPVTFIAAPVVMVIGQTVDRLWGAGPTVSTTGANFRLYGQVPRTGNTAGLTASGRWRA